MNPPLMRQFSLRTALLVIAITACVFVGVKRYVTHLANFGWPDEATMVASKRPLTPPELKQLFSGGGEGHSAKLLADHPPRGAAHWKQKAKEIKPGMTQFALLRQIPHASRATSSSVDGLNVDPSRLKCYAVDSEFAIVVWMSYEQMELTPGTTDSFGRVKEVVGLFKHDGRLNKYGCLESAFTQNLVLTDRIPIN